MPVKITKQQLIDFVNEAEGGYDTDMLQQRGRGRPGRGAQPSQVISVRLTPQELQLLDHLAEQLDLSRSATIRHTILRAASA